MNAAARPAKFRLKAASPVKSPDGRKHRSQKSRQRIVDAMFELVAQGNLSPSADHIADAAHVGRRSVFRHFSDMDSLYSEINDRIAATIGSVVTEPFAAADWQGKILELVDRRAAAFETMKPFLSAAQAHRHRSAFLKTSHIQFVGLLRSIVVGLLPRDAAQDQALVEGLDLLLGFESWTRLRESQTLDVPVAKGILKNAIGALFAQRQFHDSAVSVEPEKNNARKKS